MLLVFLAFFLLPLTFAITCHSQLCLDENACSAMSTCRMDNGYCYNRIFYIPHGSGGGRFVRGAESGCSTEFTSIMAGRCAGDPWDEEFSCVCSADLCNEYFLNGSMAQWPDDSFWLRRIRCAEDDEMKCRQHHRRVLESESPAASAPCKIDHRTYCSLIKESTTSSTPLRRHGRAGYWPLIEYVYSAIREIVCIQGVSMNQYIECYCKYDNCNNLREDRGGKLIRIDYQYPLIKCLIERRFYASDDLIRLFSFNRSSEIGLESLPTRSCSGHSCYAMYERELNATRPWIRLQRGCMNFSRPWAFFNQAMDAEYGSRQRGMQICREHDNCNNVSIYRLIEKEFRFSIASKCETRFCLFTWLCYIIIVKMVSVKIGDIL